MGYTTDFSGSFKLSRPVTIHEKEYLDKFTSIRHMKRDVDKLQELYKGEHGLNGDYGVEGEYFTKDDDNYGQSKDASIVEYNYPPTGVPGLWCQWTISGKNNDELEWDGGKKFYNYIEWLQYLIKHFFAPWGVTLNGEVYWYGEDRDDIGKIICVDNKIEVKEGHITY